MIVTMDRRWPPHRILAQLSEIQQTSSMAVAFCCDPGLASVVFREAHRLNMLSGEWVWLILEQAARSPTSADLPPGLLGLVSQPVKFTKHTMKGSLAVLHSAIKSITWQKWMAWNSSWNATGAQQCSRSVYLNNDVAKQLHR